jgi:DtxR family Mn-dependent transcriptional regulator
MLTEAVEDYLKAIYELQFEREKVANSDLAAHLGVAPASVTGMLKKLTRLGLVSHRRYHGVVLTESGRAQALTVIRHHRLAETFLAQSLGLALDQIHEEAHKWEHAMSPAVADRLDALLGHPTADPHGSPIPTSDGKVLLYKRIPLAEVEPGQCAVVAEVSDHDPARLHYLKELGLLPKARVSVLQRQPCDGPVTIRVEDQEYTVGLEVTQHVYVKEIQPDGP